MTRTSRPADDDWEPRAVRIAAALNTVNDEVQKLIDEIRRRRAEEYREGDSDARCES